MNGFNPSTTMSNYSKTPWCQSIGDDVVQIISHADGEGLIAEVNAYNGSPKGRANADLIASAPDLLAALKQVSEFLESLNKWADPDRVYRAYLKRDEEITALVDSAIAKATGKQL